MTAVAVSEAAKPNNIELVGTLEPSESESVGGGVGGGVGAGVGASVVQCRQSPLCINDTRRAVVGISGSCLKYR